MVWLWNFFFKGKSSTEIKTELHFVHGDSAPSFSTVISWVADFERGRTNIFDKQRSGHPKTATTYEMVDCVYEIVVIDVRRSGILEIELRLLASQ